MKSLWKWPWRLFRGRKNSPHVRRALAHTRLAVEQLEDRLALSTTTSFDPVHEAWRDQRFTTDDVAIVDPSYAAWRTNHFSLGEQARIDGTLTSVSPHANWMEGDQLVGLDKVFANYTYKGDGYSVAVIDTGIDYRHPALGCGWCKRVIAGWDFVNNDADPMDDNGHGTHVAGIIGSSDANYPGIAPHINLIALKVLDASGSGSFGAVEDALNWVASH